jgi:hypothetical protein
MRLWRSLDAPTVAAWETFSSNFPQTDKYGNPITWSGFNWFWKFNRATLKLYGSSYTTPPDSPVSDFQPVLTLTDSPPPLQILLTSVPAPIGDECITVNEALNQPKTTDSPPSKYNYYDTLYEDEATDFPITRPGEMLLGGYRHFFLLQTFDNLGRSVSYSPLWVET